MLEYRISHNPLAHRGVAGFTIMVARSDWDEEVIQARELRLGEFTALCDWARLRRDAVQGDVVRTLTDLASQDIGDALELPEDPCLDQDPGEPGS